MEAMARGNGIKAARQEGRREGRVEGFGISFFEAGEAREREGGGRACLIPSHRKRRKLLDAQLPKLPFSLARMILETHQPVTQPTLHYI